MNFVAQNECIKSLIKLKRQEEIIEKTLEQFLDNMKLEPDIMKIVKNKQCSCMLERRKLSSSLQNSLVDITNCWKEIKSSINELQHDRKIDIDNFREKLISLANKIREFRKDFSIDCLTEEEIELDRDMHVFSISLSKYEARSLGAESKKCNSSVVPDSHDFTGAKDFDSLIAKTGHTQNWNESDHLFFLKVRKKSQSIPSMVASIRKKCPDITAERIINHEAWYKIYLDFREKQRNAIQEWREKKETRKHEKKDKQSDIDKNRFIRNEGIADSDSVKTDKGVCRSNEKFNNKREIVRKWRADRDKATSFEMEQSEIEKEARRVWKENRRLARAKTIKRAIVEYKEKKIENTESTSTNSGTTDSGRNTSKSRNLELRKCFRLQDEEFSKRRKALLQRKKSRATDISSKNQSRSTIEKSTLLNPTKVWLEKCKSCQDSDPEVSSRGISYVKYIPKLGAGAFNWRSRQSA